MAARNKITLFIILVVAFFVRSFRVNDLLGFYYDQGRDALIIWDLWHKGKTFLIGPTTGIEGIFLGPLYYYLITPFYILGQGNPVFPATFLAIMNTLSIALLFYIGLNYFNVWVGLLATLFSALSFTNLMSHRWLSNPNPLTLISTLILLCLFKLTQNKPKYFPIICLLIGLGLQFEAASAIFFIPSLLITLIIFRKNIKINLMSIMLGLSLFGATLLPQLVFDFRHDHILTKAFYSFLIERRSFVQSPLSIIGPRLSFYLDALNNQFFPGYLVLGTFWLIILVLLIKKNKYVNICLIWILTPLIILLLYTGNNGYVWGYYFTGIYPILFLLVAVLLSRSKIISIVFLSLFLLINIPRISDYLFQPLTSMTHVTLGTSLAAVDWVRKDAGNKNFNVDVYVPPVVPYAYDYLFLWRGKPSDQKEQFLYTIYEVDIPHPERLQVWLNRQKGIGAVEDQIRFGGIIVQRRHRI